MLPDQPRLVRTLENVDRLICSGRYADLEELSGGKRLAEEHLKTAVEEYLEELKVRPDYELEDGAIVFITGSDPSSWSVHLHLWSKNSERSDLTAELTLADTGGDQYDIIIDDIRVL